MTVADRHETWHDVGHRDDRPGGEIWDLFDVSARKGEYFRGVHSGIWSMRGAKRAQGRRRVEIQLAADVLPHAETSTLE